jgi:hypothetical protein
MQPGEHLPLHQDQADALFQACDSDNIEHLQNLVRTFQARPQDLRLGFWAAINHNHPRTVRYLLEQGVDSVDAYVVERALRVSAIQVLDVLKEFGWNDVNMSLREIGSLNSGAALTALLQVIQVKDDE